MKSKLYRIRLYLWHQYWDASEPYATAINDALVILWDLKDLK